MLGGHLGWVMLVDLVVIQSIQLTVIEVDTFCQHDALPLDMVHPSSQLVT